MRFKDKVAPIPAIRLTIIGWLKSTQIGHSAPWTTSAGYAPWMILRPYPAALMRAYPVGTRVGNVRNNDAGLLDEISIAA